MNPLAAASGLLTKITAAAGRMLVTSWGRKVADGKLGAGPAGVYYWLSAHAIQITGGVAVLAAALESASRWPEYLVLLGLTPDQVKQWSGWLAGYAVPVLLALKIVTDQWHSIGHPDWLRAPWALWLKAHGTAITYLSAGAWWYAERCGTGGWCAAERWAIFLIGLFCAVTGIAPRADHAIPPAQVLAGLAGLIEAPTPKVAEQAAQIAALPQAGDAQQALMAVASVELQPGKPQPDEKAAAVDAIKSVAAALDNAKGA